MDYLLEMIINAIVAAFRDRTPAPPKRPAQIPRPQTPKTIRPPARPPQRRPIPQPLARQIPPRQRPGVRPAGQKSPATTASPRPVSAKPAAKPAAPPAPAAAPLSAAAIGQLLRSRPAALRSVIVLSEILQPPLAMR